MHRPKWTSQPKSDQCHFGPLSETTRVSQYQKKQSPTHTYLDHQWSFISFLHVLQSIASSLFNSCAWQSFRTTSLQVLFGLPLGLEPSAFYAFRNTCPYHHNLFCCSTEVMSSIPNLSLKSLLGTLSFTLMLHIYLTILISACKCHLIFFPCRPDLTSMQHTTSYTTAAQSLS